MQGALQSIVTVLVAFFVVIGLIFLTRYALQFFEPFMRAQRKDKSLVLLHVLPLDSKRRVQVVRYGNDVALFLTGGNNDLFLGWRHNVFPASKEACNVTSEPVHKQGEADL